MFLSSLTPWSLSSIPKVGFMFQPLGPEDLKVRQFVRLTEAEIIVCFTDRSELFSSSIKRILLSQSLCFFQLKEF